MSKQTVIAEAVRPAFEALSEKYHPVNIDLDGKITSVDEYFARPTIDYNVTTSDALQPELGSARCGYAGCNVAPEDRCSLCPQGHRTTWADVKDEKSTPQPKSATVQQTPDYRQRMDALFRA